MHVADGCCIRQRRGAAATLCSNGACSRALHSIAWSCPLLHGAVLAWMSASALTRLAVPRKLSTMVLRFQAINTCRILKEL